MAIAINRANGQITLGSPGGLYLTGASGASRGIVGTNSGSIRWQVQFGNDTVEGALNAGSDFGIYSYDNAGNYIGNPFLVSRGTGQATFAYQANFNGPISANSSITTRNVITIDGPSGFDRQLLGRTQTGLNLWLIDIGNSAAMSGGNVGADFGIHRYADGTGGYLGNPLAITRSSGLTTINNGLTVNGQTLIQGGGNWYSSFNFMPTGGGNGIIEFFHANQQTARGYVGWLSNDTGIYLVNQYSGNYVQVRNDGWTTISGGCEITSTGQVDGNFTCLNNIQANGTINSNSNISASGTLSCNGGATVAGNFQCNNNINCYSITTSYQTIYGNLQVNGTTNVNGQCQANPINSAGNNFAHGAFYCDNASGGFFERDTAGNFYCQFYCGTNNVAYVMR